MTKLICLLLVSVFVLVIQLHPATTTADLAWMSRINDITEFSQEIYDMADSDSDITAIENKQQALNSAINNLHFQFRIISLPDRLVDIGGITDLDMWLQHIVAVYWAYNRFSKEIMSFGNRTLLHFVHAVTTCESGGFRETLTQIHEMLAPKSSSKPGLLDSIADQLKNLEFRDHCRLNQSPRQLLQNYYFNIAIYQLKGLVIQIFAYTILRLFNKGDFTNEIESIREDFESNLNKEIKVLKTISPHLSQEVWECDPDHHVEGKTYEEATELLQGFLINESDIDEEGSCKHSCSTLPKPMKTNHCRDKLCQNQRKCAGSLYTCRMLTKDRIKVEIGAKHGGSRYARISFGETVYGPGGYISSIVKVQNWISENQSCDYCWCLCDEQGPHSDRYFNLRPTIADTENNKVVTGLRIVKKNRIIHLQIQEGKLLPGGVIDYSSVRWVPVDDYKLDDTNVTNGQDYHALHYHQRMIGLDDVRAKEGEVVIGVRLVIDTQTLLISILATSFNISTGLLKAEQNAKKWRYNKYANRTTVPGGDFLRSITVNSSSHPSETPSKVWVTVSSLKYELRQFTIPTLDAQPVQSSIPVPLEGVGLYHKGQREEGYAGFVAPKLITYDYGHHIED